MIAHGSKRPRPNRGWRFLSKASQAAILTAPPVAIAAATKVTVPSTGIQITLLARQAILIRRYISTIIQSGALNDRLFAIGGEFNLQKAPFGLGTGVVTYPLMEAIAVPQALAITNAPIGQQLFNAGLDFALIDDWLEFDDSAGDGNFGTFQLQANWEVFNMSAGVLNVVISDRATWEIYEIPLVGVGNDP